MRLSYNNLNLPDSAYFMLRGNTLKMEYMADGRRVRTTAKTYGTPLLIPVGGTPMPQEPASVTEEVRDGELVFRDGRLVEVRTDGGWFSMWNDTLSTTQVRSYFYVTDYLGSVRLTVDCNGSNSGTANARQGMEYLPSGAIFRSTDYDMQTRRFCGKGLITVHGWNMYDSQARYQYSLLPRFSTMDPLAEKYYGLSPYNYAGNDWVNKFDENGKEIRIPWKQNIDGKEKDRYFVYQGGQLYFENGKPFSGQFGFARDVQNDLNMIKEESTTFYEYITELEESPKIHTIKELKYYSEYTTQHTDFLAMEAGRPTGSVIMYNPHNNQGPNGRIRPSRVGLAHELSHSRQMNNGTVKCNQAVNGIEMGEIDAIKDENIYRTDLGLELRNWFNGKTIPQKYLK